MIAVHEQVVHLIMKLTVKKNVQVYVLVQRHWMIVEHVQVAHLIMKLIVIKIVMVTVLV